VASSCTGAAAKAPGEVADLGRRAACSFGGPAGRPVLLRRPGRTALGFLRTHLDQLRRRARLLEGLGDHERDGLVVVLDLRAAQQFGGVALALAELAGILAVTIASTPGARARRRVHRGDAALGDARADDIAIGLVGRDIVLLIGIGRRAGGLARAVDAVDRLADDLQLVDRVGGGGCVEFHGIRPFAASARRRACARPAAA
jgi:hypothetical protein